MLLTPRRRPLLCLLAIAAVLAAEVGLATTADAHGGNFRAGDAKGADPDAPVLPGDIRPTATTARSTWRAGTWHTWWRLNAGALLPDKRTVRRRAVTTVRSSFFQMGASTPADTTPWDRAVRAGAVRLVVPFLLDIVDPARESDDRLVAAALLALGRSSRDASLIPLLQRYAAREDGSVEVRESAVLAMGLLRRSERADQLMAASLTELRRFLLRVFDDKDVPTRVRAFAIYSLALLSDQPYAETPLERDGRHVTRALWRRLSRKYASGDLPVALLTALGMQPAKGVPSGVLEGLRAIASGQLFARRKWDGLKRSHALTAYVRLGGPGWLPTLLRTLRGTHDHVAVRSAAAIALQRSAGALDADERMRAARALRRALPKEAHWLARGLGQMALGRLVREDLAAGESGLTATLRIDEYLRHESLRGRTMTRPFAALALGLSVHDLDPGTKPCAVCIRENRKTLLEGLKHGRGSDETLGAYAVGLGLAGAENAHALLLSIVRDRHRGASLRGHCAVALAQIGHDTPDLRAALDRASQERVAPQVHTGAVRALSLLARPETTKQLLEQLEKTRSRYAVAVIAGALGRFGDPAAAEALVKRARDPLEALQIRVMSIVALGLIFDPEPRPSRVLMTTYANYPSRTPALTQIFNIM